jgi:hypothetical protein
MDMGGRVNVVGSAILGCKLAFRLAGPLESGSAG